MRGEHATSQTRMTLTNGSAPRACGARHHARPEPGGARLSPTGVGSTPTPRMNATSGPAQPHVREEHDLSIRSNVAAYGSAPRAWEAR